MELRSQNPTVYVVHNKRKQSWEWNLCTVFLFLRKTGSEIYRCKINSSVEMFKGKVGRNMNNSSEDGVCKFIVVWRIEGGNNCWKVWRSSGTFLF